MLQKQMRCQIKAESLFFPTMYKSEKVTFPTCSGFCGSGSHMTSIATVDYDFYGASMESLEGDHDSGWSAVKY